MSSPARDCAAAEAAVLQQGPRKAAESLGQLAQEVLSRGLDVQKAWAAVSHSNEAGLNPSQLVSMGPFTLDLSLLASPDESDARHSWSTSGP